MKNKSKKTGRVLIIVATIICIIAVIILVRKVYSYISARLTQDDEAEEWLDNPENTSDWMYEDFQSGVTLQVFSIDGKTYTVDETNVIDIAEPLEDGHFYEIIADVTILNGGVAGYYNYPQIEQITGCEEIAPSDLKIPSITEKQSGLVEIGDYADGDIFFNNYYDAAVWKDGDWVWRYDKRKENEDGTLLYYRDGVSEEDMKSGIENGVLACGDYFFVPIHAD